jgi:hypothetical protein
MEETEQKPVEWHKFKDNRHVAVRGEEILAIIEPIADFPCEAYGLHLLNTMHTTLDSAKAEGEKLIANFIRKSDQIGKPPEPSMYLTVLRQVVAVLEQQEAAEKK